MAITLKDIIGTITGKLAFERTQENFTTIKDAHNSLETVVGTKASNTKVDEHMAEYAKEPTIFSLTAKTDYKLYFGEYRKKNGFVFINVEFGRTDEADIPLNTVISALDNLPVGFRPVEGISMVALGSPAGTNTVTKMVTVLMYNNGAFYIKNETSIVKRIRLTATFYAGGGTI